MNQDNEEEICRNNHTIFIEDMLKHSDYKIKNYYKITYDIIESYLKINSKKNLELINEHIFLINGIKNLIKKK